MGWLSMLFVFVGTGAVADVSNSVKKETTGPGVFQHVLSHAGLPFQ